MSEGPIEITVEGDDVAAAHLEQMGSRAADVRPAQAMLDPIFADDSRKRFDEQGPGWARLSDAAQDQKAAAGLDPRILRATGALYDSLVRASSGPPSGSRDSLALGTDVPYARFHQHGTQYMPERKPVDLSTTARRRMEQMLSDYITEGKP